MFGNQALCGFEYKGYTYGYDLQQEDDNCKTLHEAKTPRGDTLHFDWSPYSNPTADDFKLWIDLGCPERITNGPLNREDLDYIRGAGLITYRALIAFENGFCEDVERLIRVTCASHRLATEIISKTWTTARIIHLQQDRRSGEARLA